MAVKAKRLVMDGQDVLPDETVKAEDAAAQLAELRALADKQLRAERECAVAVLDRIGKGLAGWRTSREGEQPWRWCNAPEALPAEWRGLARLGLLFAELEALRDRIGYLEAFHKPLWCASCSPGEEHSGAAWMKWDCVEHTTWLTAQAMNIGRDLFGGFLDPAPAR